MDPSLLDDFWGSMQDEEYDPSSREELKDIDNKARARAFIRIINEEKYQLLWAKSMDLYFEENDLYIIGWEGNPAGWQSAKEKQLVGKRAYKNVIIARPFYQCY